MKRYIVEFDPFMQGWSVLDTSCDYDEIEFFFTDWEARNYAEELNHNEEHWTK